MGPYLSAPKKEKHSEDGENGRLRYGASGMQGWRSTMEDAHIVSLDLAHDVYFFGVYDGHGGNEVADFVKDYLIKEMKELESFKKGDYGQAMTDAYFRMDEILRTPEGKDIVSNYMRYETTDGTPNATGCTACSAIITSKDIIVANTGDSRAVLAKKGADGKYKALDMSIDHKPEMAGEKARIEKAEGFVEANRVNGVLGLSRSIGDLDYKKKQDLPAAQQMVTALPDIKKESIGSDTAFLIIACDGIWDCLSSQQAVDDFGALLDKGGAKISASIEEVFDKIIAPSTTGKDNIGCDNMTCIVVQFKAL